MAKTEIAKASDTTRPRDLFTAMRSDVDRMFERFEHGFPGAKIDAKFDNGVLKVTATKKPEAVKAQRKIEIRQGS